MRRLISLALFAALAAAAYAQEQPPPKDAQLTVIVKDEQGNPVPGAKILCAPTDHSLTPDPLPEPLQGVTDAEGRCPFGPLPRMTHYILARTDTHGAWGRADFSDPPTTTVELTLKRGLSRALKVRDPQGKPIPEVAVVYRESFLLGRTDEKGQFVLPNLDAKDSYQITFFKEGYGFVRENYWLNAGRTDVTMAPGMLVEGTVKDPEGQPAANARVSSHPFEVRSDAQGRFRLGWYPIDQHHVQVTAQFQKGDIYLLEQQDVETRPGTNNLDMVFHKPPDPAEAAKEAAAVEGKVVMKDTGEPVPATIFYTYSNGPESWYSPHWKETGRDGLFRIENVAGGQRLYLAIEPKRKTLYCVDGVLPVDLKKGETTKDVVATVDEGCAISGRVLDHEGNGIPNAQIMFEPKGAFVRYNMTHGTGAFILANLEKPGEPYTLIVAAPGQTQQLRKTVEPIGKGKIAQTELRFDAPVPAGTLRGLVVDIQGKPVAGAQIVLIPPELGDATMTDDEGRYEIPFRVLEARRATLQIYVQKQAYIGNSQRPVGPDVEIVSGAEQNLEPGKTIEAERVVLKLTPKRYITGRVTDPAGAVVNANITVLGDEQSNSEYANGGMFMLRKVPMSGYVIEVTAQGYRARILEPGRDFPADAEEIKVTLQKGPFSDNASIFSQVTGHEESIDVIDSLPAGKTIHDRCRNMYPAMAGNNVQGGVPID